MNLTIQQVYEDMDHFYPFATQMSFDNAGFLVGDGEREVQHILIALDITTAVIDEAIEKNCQLIITHHPVIFTPLKSLRSSNPTEKMILKLVEHKIAVISAHTNLDRSLEGVNFHLARLLGIKEGCFVVEEGTNRHGTPYGLGWMGEVHEQNLSASAYARFVAKTLGATGLRLEDTGRPVHKVAVGGGSCGSMLADVAKCGCDTFITGDVKYDVFLEAKERNINLIDAGHFPTEQIICPILVEKLKKQYESIHHFKISLATVHKEVSVGIL